MDNLPIFDIKTDMDPSLEVAMQQAETTNNLTPLIKQELKYTILNRRHKSGQGDVVIDDVKPKVKRELTSEEIKKKLKRKEQNRRAAQRCREKKKVLAEHVLLEYIQEQKISSEKQREIDKLKMEKAYLEQLLSEHAFKCMRAMTPTPVTPSHEDQTTFQYGTSCEMDTMTPFPDPFDETIGCQSMFDQSGLQQKPEIQQQTLLSLTDLDIPDSLVDLNLNYFQLCSPEIQNGGRRSISEYIEPDTNGGVL